jgi:hypothetical protein
MARRYDSRTTIFSPEGRLYQVEYAMEAISNAGAAIGMLCKDGVVLVAEKKITSKLLDTHAVGVRREKMYKLDDHVCCAVAGITGATVAQQHLQHFGCPQQLVLCLQVSGLQGKLCAACVERSPTGCMRRHTTWVASGTWLHGACIAVASLVGQVTHASLQSLLC